jgi:23S rRNA (uracil1939-C5)-methyltransferase
MDAPRPPCPHYPDCAGCALIGTPYTAQLEQKHARVAAAMAAHPSLAGLEVPRVIGSPRVFGYRNQAKLVARRARRSLLLGVYRPGTHDVVDIGQCPVHHPLVARALAGVRAALEQTEAPAYDERAASGWLRYVVVRGSEWKKTAQVILVVRDRQWRGETALLARLRRLRGVSSVMLNVNTTPGNVIFGPRFMAVTREPALFERIGGLKLRSGAGSFLQANIGTARRVYEQVARWADVQPGEVAVDLYCGVGAISFYLAGQAGLVVGIEENPIAVGDARLNIRLNGYHNVRFRAGASGPGLAALRGELDGIDVITLNPPRKGADLATRTAIAAAAPSRIVYVSCDPETLARDLDWFAAHRYRAAGLQPYDMMPQTDHIECVALLRRV